MKLLHGSFALLLLACEPPAGKPVAIVDTSGPPARGEACRDDIPDCIAACALRETHRMEFVDFYERRCAAVVLGKNPDKVDLMPTPYVSDAHASDAGAAATTTPQEFPPDHRGSLSMQPTQSTFDPNTMTRTGGSEPPECKAARMLRAQRRDREADMLSALCVAKGGDGGA
jgi:hypothetical protein